MKRKHSIKVSCNCCHKEMDEPLGFPTPYGAMIFSCGKKSCDAVIIEVLFDCFGSYYEAPRENVRLEQM